MFILHFSFLFDIQLFRKENTNYTRLYIITFFNKCKTLNSEENAERKHILWDY